jgi:hypothetical protein
MDHEQKPHTYAPKITAAIGVMERMNEDQLDRAFKILDALAEPARPREQVGNGN